MESHRTPYRKSYAALWKVIGPFGQEIVENRIQIWLITFCITLIRKTAKARPKLDGGAGNPGKSGRNLANNFLYNFDTENGQNAPKAGRSPFWARNPRISGRNLANYFLHNFDTENGKNAPKAGRSPFWAGNPENRVEIWLITFCITLIRNTAKTRPKLDGDMPPYGKS